MTNKPNKQDNSQEKQTAAILEKLSAALSEEHAARWLYGDRINELAELIGSSRAYRAAAKYLAASERWANELAVVARVFADPEERKLSPHWTLYRVAAWSKDPHNWLRYAVLNGLTAGALAERIRLSASAPAAVDELQEAIRHVTLRAGAEDARSVTLGPKKKA